MTIMTTSLTTCNVAEAKKHFSDLLGRVAYRGEEVVITRRGKPMARLVPMAEQQPTHLSEVKGWLAEDDPFFDAIDEIVAARSRHLPRPVKLEE